MGNQPPAKAQQNSLKKDEQKVLIEATNITRQLKLYETEAQLRDQRHLLARILLYGHDHLITHLKQFPKDKQLSYLRYLRTIDFQTTDLLYQNLVVSRIRGQKIKVGYQKLNIKDKKRELTQNSDKSNSLIQIGQMLLSQKKIAILVFAGGSSSRFRDASGTVIPKQLYKASQGQKCLLEIMFDKIQKISAQYGRQLVYVVYNENNHKKINTIIAKYANSFRIKKILQDQMPIVNLSGKLCIKDRQNFEILMSPNGCGNFLNCTVGSKKFLEDVLYEKCQYIYATGVENIAEEVCDSYMIGLLESQAQTGVVFKCTHPENQGQNLPRIVKNSKTKIPQVKDLQQLLQRSQKQCIWDIRRSPVFMNSIYFKISHLQQLIEKAQQKLGNQSILLSPKKWKADFWNPIISQQQENQHCYIFEKSLSDLLITGNPSITGVMVNREEQYIPILSLNGEKKWKDGKEQYEYLKTNRYSRNEGHISLMSNYETNQQI